MRTLALMATLTMVALAFAGCSGDGDGDGDSSSSSSSTSRSSSSSTSTSTSRSATSTTSSSSTSTGPSNRAPSGSISVAVNGTDATFALTGSDPDGDTLVWDLTFGDGNSTNGTSLPANVTHVYSAAGNFTANFTITDGKSPVTYDVELSVASGSQQQVFAGAWEAGGPIACEQIADGDNLHQDAGPMEGVMFVTFAIDSASVGKDFLVEIAPTAPVGMYELDFYGAPNGGGSTLAYFPPTDPTAVMITSFGGTVPAGAVSAVFFPCTAGPGEFTFTAPA